MKQKIIITSLILIVGISLFFNWKFYRKINPPTWQVQVVEPNIESYGGDAIQISGPGSRMVERTAYLLDEHGYLSPAEEWVKTWFNSAAYIMYVECREGYKISSCKSSSYNKLINDPALPCGIYIEEKMQNKAEIICNKN